MMSLLSTFMMLKPVTVDFFILQSQDDEHYLRYITTKLHSYYQEGKTVIVYADDKLCQWLDESLWFDHDKSFIPHFYITSNTMKYSVLPIVFVSDALLLQEIKKEVLLDLTEEIATEFRGFEYFVKIVDQEPSRLQTSRKCYQNLRLQEVVVNVHS